MWQFFKRKQAMPQPANSETQRRPLSFPEILAQIGDISDLATHDVRLNFWLPEPVFKATKDLSEYNDLSISEFLRQSFAIHCYGLYAFQTIMNERNGREIFLDPNIKYSKSIPQDEPNKKRITTYWVPELGKNISPIKVWIPHRMKNDLQSLADHVSLTLSNYVREIVISRVLGHGMLPCRPELFHEYPSPMTEAWDGGRAVPWKEISYAELSHHNVIDVRNEWIDFSEENI